VAPQPLLFHALPPRKDSEPSAHERGHPRGAQGAGGVDAAADGHRPRGRNGETSVLLVDDQPAFRSVARSMFERDGAFKVISEAADGADAVRKAGEHSPDVVVMDIRMPVMTGIEAARRILARRPETNVVLISMGAESEYPRLARQIGARAFITKRSLTTSTLQGAVGSGPSAGSALRG